jgi:hypothetical protein
MDEADALDNSFSTFCKDYDELPNPLDCSPAEQFYLDNNWSMLLLATLSIGAIDENGLPLLDVQNDPWKKYQKNLSSRRWMLCVQRSDVFGTHCSKRERSQHQNIGINIK